MRNLTIADAYDCFPAWDPADTAVGNWNSAYDNVSVWTSTSVWVDHNTFDDGEHPHSALPTVYGRPFEVHDGLLDITHGSDLVTVSYNRFDDHDKTELIGSSDSRPQDRGQHRVTLHHNHWIDIGQRAPRVRFGDVHVYDNLYTQTTAGPLPVLLGCRDRVEHRRGEQRVRAAPGVDPGRIITRWGGTQLLETGSTVNGEVTDLVAAFNATAPLPLAEHRAVEPRPTCTTTRSTRSQDVAGTRPRRGRCRGARLRHAGRHRGPRVAVLSDDNGWDTGLHDGDVHRDRHPVVGPERHGRAALRERRARRRPVAHRVHPAPPDAWRSPSPGRPDGRYTYVVELLNPYGTSTSRPGPSWSPTPPRARAVLSDDNRDGDGSFTVTSTLWWGTNATHYALYRDGELVDEQELTAACTAAARRSARRERPHPREPTASSPC